MCGSCVDQTPNIVIDCGLTFVSSKAQQPWNTTYCAYSYADGGIPDTPREGSDDPGRDYNFDALPLVTNYSRAQRNYAPALARKVRVFLVSAANTFSSLDTYYKFRIHDNTYRLSQGPTIQECRFSWCIQAYNVSYSNGTQSTQKLGQWTNITEPANPPYIAKNFNMTGMPSSILDTIRSGNHNWTVPQIPGDIPTRSVYAEAGLYYEPPHEPGNLTFSEFRAVSMYRITNYSAWIENAAMSITNAMRRTGEVDRIAHLYAGTAFAPEQFYDIRFWWLIFPAALIALSTLLLGLTIWTTHQLQVEHWKNDALALLYTSVDPGILYSSPQPRDLADHKVTLIRSEGSAVLRKGC